MRRICTFSLTYAATMGPKDVGIFVSNSGTTREVMECLHLAAARGGTTIALTRFDNSPLAQAADLCLYTSSPEISHRSGAMSSRIARCAWWMFCSPLLPAATTAKWKPPWKTVIRAV